MLLRHHRQSSWSFILFGLIALGIIIAGGVLIFLLVRNQTRATPSDSYLSGVNVGNEYRQALESLASRIAADPEQARSAAEEVLLRVRVPSDLLDDHLSALLGVKKAASLPAPEAKITVEKIISDLIEKARNV